MNEPEIIDVEFEIVRPRKPKPWWRRLYLRPDWVIYAGLAALMVAAAAARH